MTNTTILLLLLSVAVAGVLSYLQYFYKVKNITSQVKFLAFLRFLTYLFIFILFVNPVFSFKETEVKKKSLLVLFDNTASISKLKGKDDAIKSLNILKNNHDLKEKFDIQFFDFEEDLKTNIKTDFKGSQTNIDKTAKSVNQLYKEINTPIVLISDGNQTSGGDFVYSFNNNFKLYPLVIGDTAKVFDLKIQDIHCNKYAFLKNKFPVEVTIEGSLKKMNSIDTKIDLLINDKVISSQKIQLTKSNNVKNIEFLIEASKIGYQKIIARISSTQTEKNLINNSKIASIQVIDEKSSIAILSSITHPDLGMLKRSIEINNSRKVEIIKSIDDKDLSKFNLIIVYQPTSDFLKFKNLLKTKNCLFVTGKQTDFNFFNDLNTGFQFKMTGQVENYTPLFQTDFNLFNQDNIGFNQFPPLDNLFGRITIPKSASVLLSAAAQGVDSENPLIVFNQVNQKRTAFIFGENIWRWRMESYSNTQSFEKFDTFIDKTIQFLTTTENKKNLVVEHERIYNQGESIEINAQFFNKNYEFDENANLSLFITGNGIDKNYNFSKNSQSYYASLNDLPKGIYQIKVKELNTGQSYNSSFEVIQYNAEHQFVNSNFEKLKDLANKNNGEALLSNQIQLLIDKLMKKDNYLPIEKQIIKNKPLIDWKFLLLLIIGLLTTEWFVRKYNGLL